jgi:predicted nuclease with RNAse H fold
MITLGIDLSSMPPGTAACSIVWSENRGVVRPPVCPCTDDRLYVLISEAEAIGIDAPFGWPEAFVEAVANWTLDLWNEEERDRLRFRETDRVVCQHAELWPLSVSSDRIALPAMRAMALLRRHKVQDRSGGDGRFFEVYPAGSLHLWGLPWKGYKQKGAKCAALRKEILGEICKRLPWLDVPDSYAESSDALDALVASLTARAAKQGLTDKPKPDQLAVARREGWIHLPTSLPQL